MQRVGLGVVTASAGLVPDGMARPYAVNVSGGDFAPLIVWLDGRYWPWSERAALAALDVADQLGTGTVRCGSDAWTFAGGVASEGSWWAHIVRGL